MLKKIKSILFVICVVMVFTAQANRSDDKRQQQAPAARPAPVAHNNQSRPEVQGRSQVQSRQQVQNRREAPQQAVPIQRSRTIRPQFQPRQVPQVYAVVAPAPVENNRLFHRQHSKNWQPRYNFYDNQYHFYPYVNIASMVELIGGYAVVGPDGQNYYYDQGTFYLQDQGGQYVAVAPPVGIIVNPLAAGARQINVNGQIFYRYKGVFYVQVAQGFQVIGPVQPVPADS
jgi:hypothetical protein